MSSGAECNFTEDKAGMWTYRLQVWPYGSNEEFDHYGPFGTYKEAHEHLSENHQNPGGSSRTNHADHVHRYADVPYKTFGVTGYMAGETWTQYECVGCGEDTPEARQTARDERRVQDLASAERRVATLKAEIAAAAKGGE